MKNGAIRIAYLYDLYDPTGANAPNNPYGVGTIYDRAAINAALASGGGGFTHRYIRPRNGDHRIIAGNGSAIADQDRFKGVAPEATIISIIVTTEQIRTILQETAKSDNFNGATPNNSWGYGKIDATAALGQVFGLVSVPEVSLANLGIEASPNPFQESLLLSSVTATDSEYEVNLRNRADASKSIVV